MVPVNLFLPLLQATQACQQQDTPSGRLHGLQQLEAQVSLMPQEHRVLLEHLLCFLLNSGCDLWADDAFQTSLARVWAPCMLRAPARIMGQFQGRVIDTMGHCILHLLRSRADDQSQLAGDVDSLARSLTTRVNRHPSCSVAARNNGHEAPSHPHAAPEDADLLGPLTESQSSDCAAPDAFVSDAAILQQQQCAADDLLSTLEVMHEEAAPDNRRCVSEDESQMAHTSSQPPESSASPPPHPEPDASKTPGHFTLCAEATDESIASCSVRRDMPCSTQREHMQEAFACRTQAEPPSDSPPRGALPAPHPIVEVSECCAPLPGRAKPDHSHSHRMARAAIAALQAREAEASRLKQRAQRLLRERSALACELEGLHEGLTRTDRAIARSKEQAAALRAESSRCSTSDSRRHSTQIAAMTKAIGREKQRRLGLRNELVGAQRQLSKKRALHDAVAAKLVHAQASLQAQSQHKAEAEHGLREAQRLEQQLRECRMLLRQEDANGPGTGEHETNSTVGAMAISDEILQVRQSLVGVRQALAEERDALAKHPASREVQQRPGHLPQTAPPGESEIVSSLRSELERQEILLHSDALAAAEWRRRAQQLHHLLYRLWPHERRAGDRSRLEVLDAQLVSDAARWRAESQAFAAEAQRVEHAQARAEGTRSDEREGWHDFRQQVQADGSIDAANDEFLKLQTDLSRTSEQLHAFRREAQELRRIEDELRLGLLQVANKESSLERILLDLSAEMSSYDM